MEKRQLKIWDVTILLSFIMALLAYCFNDINLDIIKKVHTERKVVALTFDDGPNAVTTPEILAILRDNKVKATFFILGRNAEKNMDVLREVANEGHEIGSHAYSHRLFTRMPLEECLDELMRTEKIITQVAAKPNYFRPPGGAYNASILNMIKREGYETILWTVDPCDWRNLPVQQVVNTVIKNVQPGRIVLMHDGNNPLSTPAALKDIIKLLRKDGYSFVTISELINLL